MSGTMLYKAPGPHAIHGGHYAYIIVRDDEMDAALADGWKKTTPEALEACEMAEADKRIKEANAWLSADATPTRSELEQKATELGLKFDGRTSDKKLRDLITATLEA